MSLINDALKKSSGNKINLKGAAPMEPAGPEKSGGGGKGFTVFLICFVLAGGAALFAWKYWNEKYKGGVTGTPKTTNATAAKAPPSTNNNPIARAAAVFNKVLDRNKEGEQTAAMIQTPSTNAPAPATTAANAGTTPAGTKKSPILLKPKPKAAWIPGFPRVQAIIYKENDPTAIIDGKTVRPGDKVGEVLILDIKKDSVAMRLKDETHDIAIR